MAKAAAKREAVKEIAGILFDVQEQMKKAAQVARVAGVPLGLSLKQFGFYTQDEVDEMTHDGDIDWNNSRC